MNVSAISISCIYCTYKQEIIKDSRANSWMCAEIGGGCWFIIMRGKGEPCNMIEWIYYLTVKNFSDMMVHGLYCF